MDCTYGQTGENHTLSLDLAPPVSDHKGYKTVDADIGKWELFWSDTVLWQVCHLLFSNWCLSLSEAETVIEGLLHCSASLHNPEPFSDHGKYMFCA